ncbi:MAG TPA: hypothetical protein VMF66_20475 [Candidatus Acidoferrum sp.]|nr:hypothetical protein [Candidatus Acidoferrum sp.]
MLIAALIFVISMATALQFVVLSWRAAVLKVASEPLSADWEPLAGTLAKAFVSKGFSSLAAYSDLCPDFKSGAGPKVGTLRLYYQVLQLCQRVGNLITPNAALWTAREMALCTRCAAVMLSHRMEQNHALSAAARSF